jgi:2-hydroxychromene-2-carboxylate isomerase
MNELSIEFLFDFGSPNAYLSHAVIPSLEARLEVRFQYVPILLGGLFKLTGNRSPAEAYAGIENKQSYQRLEMARFIARYGISEFKWNPYFPVNTLQLMRGAIAAQRDGVFRRYVDAIFAGMWEEERKMDDEEVLRATLAQAGLDADRLLAQTQDPDVKAALIDSTQQAFERGAFGAPTFYVNDQIFFGKDRLRDVEDEILRVRTGKR